MESDFSTLNKELMVFIAEHGLITKFDSTQTTAKIFSDRYNLQSSLIGLLDEFTSLMSKNVALNDHKSLKERVAANLKARLELYLKVPCNERILATNLLAYLNTSYSFKVRFLYRISDSIWQCSGEKTIEANYYTRRAMLSYIYYVALVEISNTGLVDNVFIGAHKRVLNAARLGGIKQNLKKVANFILG